MHVPRRFTRLRTVLPLLGGAAVLLAACGSDSPTASDTPTAPVRSTSQSAASTPSISPSVNTGTPTATQPPSRSPTPTRTAPVAPAAKPTTRRASTSATSLPLRFSTGTAQQVITVVADNVSSTTALVQAWQRSGSGWVRVGPVVRGNLGSDGLSTHASESRSATPIGSFTLTQAFGADADPGTTLPYTHTTLTDWWISQPGGLYNTLQHCSSDCRFTQGAPNEHLATETPAYDYAVVIDYNTRNAPGGVQAGKGSAFFLHVSEGVPTAGCVSIPRTDLTRIMRWLTPGRHPRILIGS